VSEADLRLVPQPCIAQQFYNHDANLFKVYVIDSEVMVFRRQSLPNLDIHQILNDEMFPTPVSSPLGDTKHAASFIAGSDSSFAKAGENSVSDSYHGKSNESNGTVFMNDSPNRIRCNSSSSSFRLKSVAFDSRKQYPTIIDFIEPTAVETVVSSVDGIEDPLELKENALVTSTSPSINRTDGILPSGSVGPENPSYGTQQALLFAHIFYVCKTIVVVAVVLSCRSISGDCCCNK
jgi:hypothetical protein